MNACYASGVAGELPEPAGLTFHLGFQPPRQALSRFRKALTQLGWSPLESPGVVEVAPQPAPTPLLASSAVPPRIAWFGPTRRLPLKEAVGHVAAEAITPYPPGIPLLLPGSGLMKNVAPGYSTASIFGNIRMGCLIR